MNARAKSGRLNLADKSSHRLVNLSAFEMPECVDTTFGATDSGGDTCNWYIGREDSCGVWDSETFHAYRMCCACGGG